jgi:hypothetical protein
MTISEWGFEIKSPGELLTGLSVNNLIHGVPVYRNLLLADGARFVGLCDKIGQGILDDKKNPPPRFHISMRRTNFTDAQPAGSRPDDHQRRIWLFVPPPFARQRSEPSLVTRRCRE